MEQGHLARPWARRRNDDTSGHICKNEKRCAGCLILVVFLWALYMDRYYLLFICSGVYDSRIISFADGTRLYSKIACIER